MKATCKSSNDFFFKYTWEHTIVLTIQKSSIIGESQIFSISMEATQ